MKKLLRILKKLLKYTALFIVIFAIIITVTIQMSGDPQYQGQLDESVVNDITQLNPIHVTKIIQPHTTEDIIQALKSTRGPVSIGGGRNSMGGQTAIEDGTQLDMRQFNQIVSFSPEQQTITVQSGITWHKVQEYIDPHNLAVKIMQTYANFTVGGSLSVNVHGRYIGHGPIISSVKQFTIVLADGSVKTASPSVNPDLFYSAIGGYGGVGVIADVTLQLVKNEKVERHTKTMDITEYKDHFIKDIRNNPAVVFQNADIYPPDFTHVRDTHWEVTSKPVTIEERLIPTDNQYKLMPKLLNFAASSNFGKRVREHIIDPLMYRSDTVEWRNYEASYDYRELGEFDRSKKTDVLQEYFIPVENFDHFVPKMRAVFQKNNVNVINVSIRHALPDPGSYLAWAQKEVFAFVVYYRQETTSAAREIVGKWSREMIDAILAEGGTYYLPYQPHATTEQFHKAYPYADKYFAVKKRVDPQNRFQNKLWEKYYPSQAQQTTSYLATLKHYRKGEEQTLLTLPEWYLVYNPKEYADFLESGQNPSDFPFYRSIDEYWKLYDRVTHLTTGIYPENSQYTTMLQVIGISTTAEFIVKGMYENTIGRITRWSASSQTPEEELIQQAHRAYSKFIYDEPWYKFSFIAWVKKIWSGTPFFGKNIIRKIERKIAFTLEFGFKSMYAELIGFGAQTAYEPSDGMVIMRIKSPKIDYSKLDSRIAILKELPNSELVISLPRWDVFTQIVPKLAKFNIDFISIAGNDDILITTQSDKNTTISLPGVTPLFDSMVIIPEQKKRDVLLVKVNKLKDILNGLSSHGLQLEHIYDY